MAVTIDAYDQFIQLIGDGTVDLDTDTLKMILLNTSHTRTVTNTLLSEITANQLSTANGYTDGGATLGSVTYAHSTGTVKFDSADVTWTASGGSIAASDAVIYDDTTTSPLDALLIDIDLDGLQTAGDGTNFEVRPNAANGWYTGAFTGA